MFLNTIFLKKLSSFISKPWKLAIERNFKKPEIAPRAFVGYGACIDLIASAAELFRDTNLPFPDKTEEFGVLHSQDEFVEEFFYYFQQGQSSKFVLFLTTKLEQRAQNIENLWCLTTFYSLRGKMLQNALEFRATFVVSDNFRFQFFFCLIDKSRIL